MLTLESPCIRVEVDIVLPWRRTVWLLRNSQVVSIILFISWNSNIWQVSRSTIQSQLPHICLHMCTNGRMWICSTHTFFAWLHEPKWAHNTMLWNFFSIFFKNFKFWKFQVSAVARWVPFWTFCKATNPRNWAVNRPPLSIQCLTSCSSWHPKVRLSPMIR